MKANSGCGLAEMPLYRAFALMLVKVKDTSRKVPARGTPAPVHYLCAGDRLIHLRDSLSQLRISCSQSRDSCSCRKVVRLFQKWYDFSESPTTFLHNSYLHRCLSYSRQKVLPLFCIIATSIVLTAVPIARNAHRTHEHNQRSL